MNRALADHTRDRDGGTYHVYAEEKEVHTGESYQEAYKAFLAAAVEHAGIGKDWVVIS